ncbi:MAG: ABC transporter ATP-binding protein/permease [Lachnospira sp.]|nr:ABC transporter ATP-binding protein/permease [Lachnospira sp.]MDD5830677.1 ABC transporter ATP-binding protein/permease [Lachnospira sp.]
MLELNGIRKTYVTGTTSVEALKGIDLKFRDSEFVSILGQSGCGKTTLLNIIGGLDKYTSGDLKINGRSTKDFKDRDWDAYRNNSIGFVFQSYNLIPHQTVLSNVELALTLSGVSKAERRQRATEALEKVGLKEQIHKKPNQMSGGQMQRVAIARALVNDPDILLADEPTGALDTQTSIQIMDLLKEISKDRLIIMVTHNPELATQYSTRIIRLLDGTITDDSNPYNGEDDNIATKTDEDSLTDKKSGKTKKKKTSMSFFTALSLSLNNLMTKKTRTILTAFAGSIGIIGIALILSISNGIQNYIDRVQRDTLSSYPIQLQKESVDVSSMIENMMGNKDKNVDHDKDKIYSNNIMTDMVNSMVAEVNSNNLKAFKSYLENHKSDVDGYISDIQYSYDVPLYIYSTDTSDGVTQLNPSSVMENMYGMSVSGDGMMSAGMQNTSVWSRLFDNRQMLDEQYDLIAGSWADNYNEVMLVVDENNEIDDYTLYSLGFKDPAEVKKIFKNVMAGNSYETEETQYTYDEVLDKKFKLVLPTELYRYNDTFGIWEDASHDDEYMTTVVNNAEEVKIAGIIRKNPDAASVSVSSGVAYTKDLMPYIIEKVNETQIVKQQLADPEKDVFTGMSFDNDKTSISTLENNKSLLGIASEDNPSEIDIYAKDFDSKEKLQDFIKNYNDEVTADGRDEDTINYTDYVGILMSSVSTIITAISSVLIAFVAISLVVSSIMIGIITYISVLERTKEIGVLRSIGASKKDVSRVFNAETLIEGFVSGAMGIIITLILCIPANAVIKNVTDISNVAQLPVAGAVILVIISMLLTTIAGLIPAKMAAKKDPVVALRTE